jgi:hypothetical protein
MVSSRPAFDPVKVSAIACFLMQHARLSGTKAAAPAEGARSLTGTRPDRNSDETTRACSAKILGDARGLTTCLPTIGTAQTLKVITRRRMGLMGGVMDGALARAREPVPSMEAICVAHGRSAFLMRAYSSRTRIGVDE